MSARAASPFSRPLWTLALAASALGTAIAQETLSLAEALDLARQRNGDLRAARLNVSQSEQRLIQARSAYFPSFTAQYSYNSNRTQREVGSGRTRFQQTEFQGTSLNTSWRLLDAGQRDDNVRATSRSLAAQRFSSLQTLRQTLFLVHQRYFDALRASENLRVNEAQVTRTETILRQTEARIKVEDLPRKDRLQAEADLLNARVAVLQARNDLASSQAALKAIIGWDETRPLPSLEPLPEPNSQIELPGLETVIREGLRDRADLLAQRRQLESQGFSARAAERSAFVGLGVDLTFDQALTPKSLEDRRFGVLLSFPLFDGQELRSQARQARLQVDAARASLLQSERDAAAEIETAYIALTQNRERLLAASAAREAARLNFQAAQAAFERGAADIVDVLTAQVTLTTAETNYIEAVYDFYTSDVQLRLATGQAVPGETALNP